MSISPADLPATENQPLPDGCPAHPHRSLTLVICFTLLAGFAVLSWSASRSKSSTYDEPIHTFSAWLQKNHMDFRLDAEGSALWKYWAALPLSGDSIRVPTPWPAPSQLIGATAHYRDWYIPVLYQTEGNNGELLVRRSRILMLLAGVALGLLIAHWSFELAGASAAIAATFFYALDPNFLAHSSLVKNDVTMSFIFLLAAWSIWKLGQRWTFVRMLGVALVCGVAINVKYSGLLLGPLLMGALALRVVLPAPWRTRHGQLASRVHRAAGALVVLIITGVACYFVTWATYGFRFSPTADPDLRFDFEALVQRALRMERRAGVDVAAEDAETTSSTQPAALKAHGLLAVAQFAESHSLLPQGWLAGLVITHGSSQTRRSFLLGEVHRTGKWYYFPVAIATKAPVATLAAAAASAGIIAMWFVRRRRLLPMAPTQWWIIACLALPAVLYGLFMLRSNLNLGLRHAMPLYVFIFVLIGLGTACMYAQRRRAFAIAAAALALGLAAETVLAYPNYLAFFNFAASGSEGGLQILSDSNLDWGQDLPALADWQTQHPTETLYFCYFGTVDPAIYGIRYINLPGGFAQGPPKQEPSGPGFVAISATHLQGTYQRGRYKNYLAQTPAAILNGSIYIYEYPAKRPAEPSSTGPTRKKKRSRQDSNLRPSD